ncbi:large ribosomal subunit protein uL3m-like [Saccoglossus kowalevskii]
MAASMCFQTYLRILPVNFVRQACKCELSTRISYSCVTTARSYSSTIQDKSTSLQSGHLESDLTTENLDFSVDYAKVRNILRPSPLKNEPWEAGNWTQHSKRCGVIAVKLGMMPLWTKQGERLQCTLLQLQDCCVIDYIPPEETQEKYGYLYVGAKNASPLYVGKAYADLFKKACVPVKQKLLRFRITDDAKLQPGTPLYAAHFRPGMYVDVTARSIGHGFQGVMKRWGMKGQPASHGATKTHRKMGATGGGGKPGRVRLGKKMAGQMGNQLRTEVNLQVVRVNTRYNIIYVSGTVPGFHTSFVVVKDARINRVKHPPFPTYVPDREEDLPEELYEDDLFSFDHESITFEEEVDK